jgi:hypothetical protein
MLMEWFSVLFFLLLITKWKTLGKLLRHAIALVVIDKGFVILTQVSIPILFSFSTVIEDKQTNYVVMVGLILYQMFSYISILYRLYSIRTSNHIGILKCYIFSSRRLGHLFLLLIIIAIFAAALMSSLKEIEIELFKHFGINFFSNSICTVITGLFFGVFSYLTYFLFILVVVEKISIPKAIMINYKMMRTLPFSLILQLTILMMLPGPLLNMGRLPVSIGVYLWALLGTSLSVVIYSEKKNQIIDILSI